VSTVAAAQAHLDATVAIVVILAVLAAIAALDLIFGGRRRG
jgi:hypothetical protein